jgi:hypothetical protein
MTTQDVDLQLFLSGVWTNVPLYSTGPGIKVTRGHDPDGSWPRAAKVECEINNDTLAYDPARPESALYGIAGRNTQARVVINGTTRHWCEASSWTPDRTPEHSPGLRGRASVELTAEGVLRRIGLWTDPLRSPMYRTISGRSTSIGHWSLEDDSGALILENSAPGSRSGTYKGGVTLGETTDKPLGAESTIKMVNGGQLAGAFLSASDTAGWVVAYSFRLTALPGSATYGELFRYTTSVGYTYIVECNNTTYRFTVLANDGTSLLSSPVTFGVGAEPNQWVTFRLKATQVAGNVQLEPAWYAQGTNLTLGTTVSFAGTVGRLVQWWINGSTANDQGHYGHVHAVTTVADDLLLSAISSFNGYTGERAYDRFFRLCGELGIAASQVAAYAASDTVQMGPQAAATFLSLLKEIRDSDDCRIDDAPAAIGLTLRIRKALFGQTAALALTYPSQVAIPFRRQLDDLNTHNRVTVKNASGGEITKSLTSGRMSVQAPPAGVGEYKDTVDVSLYRPDVSLGDRADWELAKGTLEAPRYAEVTVDLLANPALAAAAAAVRPGDMISVTGAEPDPVYLLVTGSVEQVAASTWTITYQTAPYEPYRIGVYDDGVWRWDTRTTTLAAGATSSATSLSLTTVDLNDVLTTAGGSIPYDLLIAGERVRVTAMTAAAGTGPYTQTATVTRSINGVVKAQLTGAEVRVYDSRRWGY